MPRELLADNAVLKGTDVAITGAPAVEVTVAGVIAHGALYVT